LVRHGVKIRNLESEVQRLHRWIELLEKRLSKIEELLVDRG
jgi:hypothetical protein